MTDISPSQAHRYQRWSGQLNKGRWTWLAIVVTGIRLILKEARTRVLVLTAGGEGLVHVRGNRLNKVTAFTVKPLDETAAGDAFIGYLMADLLAGRDMEVALRTGAAAGALAVTVAGAASSIPAPADVAALLAS